MLPKLFLPLYSVLLLVHLFRLANCNSAAIPGSSASTTFSATTISAQPLPAGKAVVELLVVVDKEFADLFQQDYQKVNDYLTAYFWDVNMRYKSLWSIDLSLRIIGVVMIKTKLDQDFIEKARASDGRTEHNRILNLFAKWSYNSRSANQYDMAVLMTNSKTEWGGGLACFSGACRLDANSKMDYGTVVWNDKGDFSSVTVAAHEMAHNLGAPHDDDPAAKCPGPYGFIMSGANDTSRYFFQRCSDAAISAYVNSDSGACLRRIDGVDGTTTINKNFSFPKAGTMQDMCKAILNDTKAYIEAADTFNCKTLQCKTMQATSTANVFVVTGYSFAPIENIQCGNGGRCFRGKCRVESKLLKNEGSGFCMNTNSRFGFSVPAQMFPCPSSKDKTPLDTLEVIGVPSGKLLATPFLYDENKESSNRCFYTGTNNGDALWTDRCGNLDNPWHVWEFRAVNGDQNRFQLVHKVTGRCAKIISNASNANVNSLPCTTDSSMIWSWVDGV